MPVARPQHPDQPLPGGIDLHGIPNGFKENGFMSTNRLGDAGHPRLPPFHHCIEEVDTGR